MSPSSIFIADQRIYALKPHAGLLPKQALFLNYLPEFEGLDRSVSEWNRNDQKSNHWQVIDSADERRVYLQGLGPKDTGRESRQLLCVTSSAGIGKSMALEQASFLRSQLDEHPDEHIVIQYHFSELPLAAESFFGNPTDATQWPILKRLEKTLRSSDAETFVAIAPVPEDYRSGVHAWLKKKMERGKVTLFIDGLDELDHERGEPRAIALRQLLDDHPRLNCMVAGRPYAIVDAYWNSLFATSLDPGRADERSNWHFCSVGMFDHNQIRRALGPGRAKKLETLAGEMELTPRTIEVLRGFSSEQFDNLHTVTDVYWESLKRTLGWDVDRKKKGLQHGHVDKINTEQYVEYVSALAITMFLAKARESVVTEIQDELLERLRTMKAWENESLNELTEKQTAIRELNAGSVEFRVFDEFETQLRWRNNTLRDFFAALWLVRYSNRDELDRFVTRIPKKFSLSSSPSIHPHYQEAWSFVSSLPSQSMLGSKKDKYDRWLKLVKHLFTKSSTSPRPTEMMAKAWPGLLIITGYLDANQRNPTQVQVATEQATTEAMTAFQGTEKTGRERAKAIVRRFLREFRDLGQSKNGRTMIHEDFVFHEIPEPASGWDKVPVGHIGEPENPPKTVALQGPFSVCAFPITRRLYRLFDPFHEQLHAIDFDKYCKEERCPVIDITWWDAKMFSIWSHSRLMTEWEWEYACRANCRDKDGKLSKYYWPDDPTGEQLSNHAWFNKNSNFQTHPVGGKDPNDYKLHDMLGNVREWTESRYHPDVLRSLRGGSFFFDELDCEVSFRYNSAPTNTLLVFGFRIARASLRKP